MSLTTVILLTLIPVVLVPGYSATKLRTPRMRQAVWIGLVGGIGVALSVCLWQQILGQALLSPIVTPIGLTAGWAVLAAALPEEACKFLLLLVLVRHVVRIEDPRDIILTSLGIALGFAVIEDAAFLIHASDRGPLTLTLDVLLRLVSVVPEHGITGMAMGALVAYASRSGTLSAACLPQALLLPLLMHAGYDVLLMLNQHEAAWNWTLGILPAAVATALLLGISLCNATAPRRQDFQQRPGPEGSRVPAVLGFVLVIVGLVFCVSMLFHPDGIVRQVMLPFCVVPLILAVDLLTPVASCWKWGRHGRPVRGSGVAEA